MPEPQAPPKIEVKHLGDYLEVMSKAVFQSGMSWKVVDAKWPGIRDAFHEFDIHRVAAMPEDELEELAHDKRVIRNRRKLTATVFNAQKMIELDDKHGGFRNYLRSHSDFYAATEDMRKQFKFLGDMGVFFMMYSVGEEVPTYEEWTRHQEAKKQKKR